MLRDAPEVVVCCSEGRLTKIAEWTLLRRTVKELVHLDGNLTAWQRGGFALQQVSIVPTAQGDPRRPGP